MRHALLVGVICFAACGASPKNAKNYRTDPNGQTCHEVEDTGTLFSHTECTPNSDLKLEHDDAERFLGGPKQGVTPSQPTKHI